MAQIKLMASDPKYVKDAQQRLKEMLQETPDDAGVLHALALTELRLGAPHQALEDLMRAMMLAPQNLVIAGSIAQAKLNQNDPKGAEEVLQKIIQDSPNSAVAAVVLGRFYVAVGRSAEAEQQFNRALSLDHNNADALQDLAALQLRSGRTEGAEQNYKRLSALPDKRFQFTHAMFLFQEGKQDVAIHELETITREDPDNRQARTLLIRAYQSAQRLSDTQKVLESALKKNPKDLDALLQRAEIYLNAKMYDKAATDLNQVLRSNPDSAPAHYVLAKLHQARGERHTYRQELLAALQLDPALSAIRVEAAGGMIADGEAKAALSLLDAPGEGEKRSLPWVVERNWALWSLGELAEMRKGIDAGLALKQSSDLLLQDGLWKLRGGEFENARKSLEQALDINPGDVRALGALNQTYTAQKQGSLALEKVKAYASRNPKAAPVQEFLGVLLVANGDRLGGRRAFEAARAADPAFARADLSLTQLDIADGKLDDAQRRLKPILAADQGNVTARLWLANLEITKGDRKAALEDFRQVVQADPNNAPALNNYAYLLSEVSDQSTEALKYAQRAKELSPTHAAYGDTLGWILYRRGLYSMAVSELERAAGSGGDAACNYHLAMAYAKVGNLERGKKVLQAGLKQNPNLPEAKTAREMLGMPQ
jgi:tetratricopeptide (TPR) repeat protein